MWVYNDKRGECRDNNLGLNCNSNIKTIMQSLEICQWKAIQKYPLINVSVISSTHKRTKQTL